MCLCETFINCNVTDEEICIQDYSVELRYRNRHGGGVLIYVKNGIKYTNITNLDNHVESVFINPLVSGFFQIHRLTGVGFFLTKMRCSTNFIST